MPNTAPHKRITICGNLTQAAGGGSEIFTFSFADTGAHSLQAAAQMAATQTKSFWDGASMGFSSAAEITHAIAEQVDAAGHVSASYRYDVSPVPGDNQNGIPTICCNAITLETDATGDSGSKVRGRFYPPATATQVRGATSTIQDVTGMAQAWKSYVTTLNANGFVVSVATTTGGGRVVPVTAVSVDNTVDTIRRRKNHVTNLRSPLQPV